MGAAEFFVDNKKNPPSLSNLKSPATSVWHFIIKKVCVKVDVSIQDAVELVKTNIARFSIKEKPCNEAYEAFFTDVERRGCRPSSVHFYRARLNLFTRTTTPQNIAEITPEMAERYLKCTFPAHSRRALSAFWILYA